MDVDTAIDKIREYGLVVHRRHEGLVVGGERLETHDDIEHITGIVFGIHFESGWWIAKYPFFGTMPVSQISNDVDIAVKSVFNVIQYDRQMTEYYEAHITYALADLQAARLPVLVTDYGILEIYQPPQAAKGLQHEYGNALSDWWIPTDSPTMPIGSLVLKDGKWVVNYLGKNESITTNTLPEAVQKAIVLFK